MNNEILAYVVNYGTMGRMTAHPVVALRETKTTIVATVQFENGQSDRTFNKNRDYSRDRGFEPLAKVQENPSANYNHLEERGQKYSRRSFTLRFDVQAVQKRIEDEAKSRAHSQASKEAATAIIEALNGHKNGMGHYCFTNEQLAKVQEIAEQLKTL